MYYNDVQLIVSRAEMISDTRIHQEDFLQLWRLIFHIFATLLGQKKETQAKLENATGMFFLLLLDTALLLLIISLKFLKTSLSSNTL